ncbi:hypothetical protein ANN_22848 [Periplaneta americana]|uniref:Reverse transcriptase domain-containing protein n=1 Tax=Periplaneta americana TaxID=6978 RepID=A0ABQ8SKG6_PERAM|nr:hypothetical protein ANN_22848 [Periplaneta americana]
MGESRNAYRVLIGRPEGKRPLGRPRRRWEDNIKMDLREVGYDGREWINLPQDRHRWRAYVRAAMNLRVPYKPIWRQDLKQSGQGRINVHEMNGRDKDPVDDRGRQMQMSVRRPLGRSMAFLLVIAQNFNMKISPNKTKIMAFQGKQPVRSKICIGTHRLEQVNSFKYLSYNLTYLPDTDISENIEHFNGDVRTINQVFTTTKTQKHTRLKAFKVLARPVLMYGSEAWTVRNSDVQRQTTAEMRFLRRTAGYSLLDHKRNELITKELKITPIYEYLNHYRQKWLNHVNRMDRSRLPTQILRYIPHGRRSLGRPLKRWTESVTDH